MALSGAWTVARTVHQASSRMERTSAFSSRVSGRGGNAVRIVANHLVERLLAAPPVANRQGIRDNSLAIHLPQGIDEQSGETAVGATELEQHGVAREQRLTQRNHAAEEDVAGEDLGHHT